MVFWFFIGVAVLLSVVWLVWKLSRGERCHDPKCRGRLDRYGVCQTCGYDW